MFAYLAGRSMVAGAHALFIQGTFYGTNSDWSILALICIHAMLPHALLADLA